MSRCSLVGWRGGGVCNGSIPRARPAGGRQLRFVAAGSLHSRQSPPNLRCEARIQHTAGLDDNGQGPLGPMSIAKTNHARAAIGGEPPGPRRTARGPRTHARPMRGGTSSVCQSRARSRVQNAISAPFKMRQCHILRQPNKAAPHLFLLDVPHAPGHAKHLCAEDGVCLPALYRAACAIELIGHQTPSKPLAPPIKSPTYCGEGDCEAALDAPGRVDKD
jgi:hypothetical protein